MCRKEAKCYSNFEFILVNVLQRLMYDFVAGQSKTNIPHCSKLVNLREIPLGISAAMNYTSCYALAFLFSLYFANLSRQSDDCLRTICVLFFQIPAIALRLWV
ncbi:hypothetical protein D1815_02510 [Aquimarina sp. AD1]|nr:hypothetical protein D1815_02510 [Aquimarina sp. AD1]RKN19240.1 hypothetical protein D7035_14010 [Aquimarina sp. AD1]